MSRVSATAAKAISIPFKIKRSPTDLLKALSKTVSLDPAGPHYSLIDDTMLGQTNPYDIRKLHLSKASGIRTAKMMIEKYPPAFMKDDCDPHVPKFFPAKEFTEKELKYPDESLIFSLMSWGKLKHAYDALQKCKDQNIVVSEECKLALLDLLCIHNSEDVKPTAHALEAYHTRGVKKETDSRGRLILLNTWKKNSEAESVFNELKNKSAEAYCSLIKGMFKHNQLEDGRKLLAEMKSKQLVPDLRVLNATIEHIAHDTNLRNDQKVDAMLERLREIREYGHAPDLFTFNACLELIASLGMYQRGIQITLDVLKEMEVAGVRPSLASYACVLDIFYPSKDIGSSTGILGQVIDEVEKLAASGPLEWRDPRDANFFPTAIQKCSNGISTDSQSPLLDYTRRLHAILMRDHNVRLLNNAYHHLRYFDFYLQALTKFDTTENVIKEWRVLTPHIFNRSLYIFETMFIYARDNGCYEFLLELWSSLLEFRPRRFIDFLGRCMSIMLAASSEYHNQDPNLTLKFASIADYMIKSFPYWNEIDPSAPQRSEEIRAPREYKWTPQMMTCFFDIQIKAKQLDVAWREFGNYQKNRDKISGELSEDIINRLAIEFKNANQIDRALEVIKFAVAANLPLGVEMLKKLEQDVQLNSENKSLIKVLKEKYRA